MKTCARLISAASVASALTVIGLAFAFCAWSATTELSTTRPRGAVENCSTQSSASFPHAYTSLQSLVVGPLALVGAGGTAPFVWDSKSHTGGFNKFPALVRKGHRVTVELSRRTRRGAGLAYGPLPQGEIHLRDTHRVVTFVACKTRRWSGSTADGRPVTFWSGSVFARSPQCVPLLVWVDKRLKPRRVVMHFGVKNCG